MRKKLGAAEIVRAPLFRVITASGTVLLLVAFVILRYEGFFAAVRSLLHTLRPLLLGILFATVLSPSYERLRTDFAAFSQRHGGRPSAHIGRTLSLIGAMLPPVLILVSTVCVLIPQLMQSLRMLSDNLDYYSGNFLRWTERYSQSRLAQYLPQERLRELFGDLQARIPALLMKTYDYTAAFLDAVLDIGIGAVFSLYLLADKPRLKRQISAICGRFAPRERLHALAARGRLTCNTFARFLGSQCKEALILGAMCWLGMMLFDFPYPVLISVIIGITNIVPYIGPLVGTVPCVLILLLVQPRSALWFVLFVVVLQQIESNFIYPRIVGQSIGLPPAWVLAAIVTGGGLFGMAGLILGVPLAAVAYALLFPDDLSV